MHYMTAEQSAETVPDENAATEEKPVAANIDPVAQAKRDAHRKITDDFYAALQKWRKQEEGATPEQVGDHAAAWMVANNATDLSDIGSTAKPALSLFLREHRQIVDDARQKARGILFPITKKQAPAFSQAELKEEEAKLELGAQPADAGHAIQESKGDVAGVDYFPERIAEDPMNPPLHSGDDLKDGSLFFQ